MLENLNDYLSLIVLVLLILFSLYIVISLTDKKHAFASRKREELYLSFLEGAAEDSDESQVDNDEH